MRHTSLLIGQNIQKRTGVCYKCTFNKLKIAVSRAFIAQRGSIPGYFLMADRRRAAISCHVVKGYRTKNETNSIIQVPTIRSSGHLDHSYGVVVYQLQLEHFVAKDSTMVTSLPHNVCTPRISPKIQIFSCVSFSFFPVTSVSSFVCCKYFTVLYQCYIFYTNTVNTGCFLFCPKEVQVLGG